MSNPTARRVVGYMLLKEIEIENANAMQGMLSYGAPSITATKGAFHNMSRNLQSNPQTASINASLRGVMVVSHAIEVATSVNKDGSPKTTFLQKRRSIMGRHEQKLVSKNAMGSPSYIQEAHCYAKMSFLVEVVCDKELETDQKVMLTNMVRMLAQKSRIAGGTIVPVAANKVRFIECEDLNQVSYELSDGYVLTGATKQMLTLIEDNPDSNALDVLIDASCIHHTPTIKDNGFVEWQASRNTQNLGWLVPITVGFHGISDKYAAGTLNDARTADKGAVDSQYVEAVYSLGAWVNPHKLRLEDSLKDAFWYYNHDAKNSLYLISTTPTNTQ